jgi:hypothetical protein
MKVHASGAPRSLHRLRKLVEDSPANAAFDGARVARFDPFAVNASHDDEWSAKGAKRGRPWMT